MKIKKGNYNNSGSQLWNKFLSYLLLEKMHKEFGARRTQERKNYIFCVWEEFNSPFNCEL